MKIRDNVIVVGSGLGGLSSAAYLSKRGYSVKVFEKLNVAGGYVNTFKRKDYAFENSTHFLAIEPYVLKLLGIEHVELTKIEEPLQAFFFEDDIIKRKYILNTGRKKIIKSFIDNFHLDKKEALETVSFFDKIGFDIKRVYKVLLKAPFANIFDMIGALLYFTSKEGTFAKKIGRLFYKNFDKVNDKNFFESLEEIKNKELKSVFQILSSFCFLLPPDKSLAVAGAYLNWTYLINNSSWIKGGTKNIVDAMVDVINKNRGEVKLKSGVKEIIIKDKKAVGVRLANGEEHFAAHIISGINASSLYNDLIKDKSFYTDKLNADLNNYISSSSIFQIYLGLPFDLRDYGYFGSANMFYNKIDVNKLFYEKSDMTSPDFFLLTNYSLIDDAYSPKGKSSIVISTRADFKEWKFDDKKEYTDQKNQVQEKILDKVKKITGLPFEKAEVIFSATPKTLLNYTGNIHGGIMGLEASVDYKDRFGLKSEIDNLFIVGADSYIGGGFNGTIYSGIVAAKQIIMPGVGV